MTLEIISLILNLVLGGGLIVTLVTLKSTKVRAEHKADKAGIENDRMVSQTVMEYIVEPLKKEINALRKDVRKLQKAVECISDCPHADDCPVRHKLQGSSGSDTPS